MERLLANRYELGDVLGKGGMANVYRAYDTLLERDVALKILHAHHREDDEHVERFRHEARAAAQLSHPGIVTVIDRGEADGHQFIVFELVDGETLKDVVARGGPLPVRRVLELGDEVGSAIAFAHGRGLVHRDVKPQNVLLGADGRARVTDFGIVRSLGAVGTTETGTVLGTSHYISPEQARGERVDERSDVYSLGVLLYELLAGDVPYSGDNFVTVALRHVNEPVPSVLERRPDTPLRLAALLERMMAKGPSDRPAMDEVVRELRAVHGGLGALPDEEATMITRAPAPPARRPRPATPQRRRRRLRPLLLALLLLAVAASAAALLLVRGGGDAPEAGPGNAVRVVGVASYDPFGDEAEHPDRVADATDGDPATYWTTETYYGDFTSTKEGVGLVLDAGPGGRLSSLTVTTDTPGFRAEIRSGDSSSGPFERVAAAGQTAAAETTWELDGDGARYFAVWITDLDDVAHVNEVRAAR